MAMIMRRGGGAHAFQQAFSLIGLAGADGRENRRHDGLADVGRWGRFGKFDVFIAAGSAAHTTWRRDVGHHRDLDALLAAPHGPGGIGHCHAIDAVGDGGVAILFQPCG
jgi:hypothetical protein